MAADPSENSPALNAEGVDARALAHAMKQWLAADPERTARILCDQSGVHERGIWQIRTGKRPHCSLDWADRLCLAMDIDLIQIAPLDVPLANRSRNHSGKPPGKHLQHISSGDLKLAHELHWRGVPLRRIARTWQASGRITYASEQAAVNSLYKAFELRGWPRHDRIAMVRRASTIHGRAGREQARQYGPDYAAYRREQRKRNGDLRDIPCAAQNKTGDPCKRWAITDGSYCVAHDPAGRLTDSASWSPPGRSHAHGCSAGVTCAARCNERSTSTAALRSSQRRVSRQQCSAVCSNTQTTSQ